MAATALHKETNRFLTRLGKTAKAGDVVTLSIASQSKEGKARGPLSGWCEFTQYTLSAPAAVAADGEPLFDLEKCNPVCAIDAMAEARVTALLQDPCKDHAYRQNNTWGAR
jgi:hypothetical protein